MKAITLSSFIVSGRSAVRKSSLLVVSSCPQLSVNNSLSCRRLSPLSSVPTLMLAQPPCLLKPQTVYPHLHSFRNYQSLSETPGSFDPEVSPSSPSGVGWGASANGRYVRRENNENGFPWSNGKGSWEGSGGRSSEGRKSNWSTPYDGVRPAADNQRQQQQQQPAGWTSRGGGNGGSQQWEPKRREEGWGSSWPNGGKQQWGNGGGGSSPRYQQFGNRGSTTPVPKVQNLSVPSYAMFGGSTMMMVSPSPALFMSENLGPPSFSKKYRCLVDGAVSFVFMRRKDNDRRRFDKDSRVVFRAKPADLGAFLSPLPYFPVAGSEGNAAKGGGKRRRTDQTDETTTLVEIGRVDNREDRHSIRLYVSADDQGYSSAARVTISITFPRTTATTPSKTAAMMEQRDTPEDSAMEGGEDRSVDAKRPGESRLEAERVDHAVCASGVADNKNRSENQSEEAVTTWEVKTTVGEMRALQMLLQSVLPSLYGWQILANPSIVNSFLTTSTKYSGGPPSEQPTAGSYNSGGGPGV
eukprot:GHVS01005131.1.p1 GENE.GHVS01005131.1~~GHVS01005131.1.p1  ORF type:complete len:524 (+),score=75.58 GHVS01005131.1:216-1787(+)